MSKSLSNVKFYNSALGDLSCDEKFNVVVCSEVLEHQEKPGHLLHHIKRIIADKGSLLITIPNGYGYFNFDKLLEDLFPPLRKAVEYCADLWVKKIGTECAKLRYKYEEARQYWYICRSSLSSNNTHHIKFTSSRIRRLLEEEGFTIAKFSNNTFLSGNILQTIFRYFATPINANCRVADFLPSWLCSNWLIAANIDS
jgi:2-polyprenyl-3-methyl-5-hydroxy-6-metoxy-1,4-benzoquinol methylase